MELAKMDALIICTFVIFSSPLVFSKDCALPIETANEENMPVLVNNSTSKYEFVYPHNGVIDLNKGEKITLVCPNPRNTLELTHTNSTLATCVGDRTIKVLNKNQDFGNVLCQKGLRGTAQSTNEKCGDGEGHIIQLGFPGNEDKFITLIEVCYDSDNGNALYTSHLLVGEEIDYASKSNFRPGFSTAELGPGVSASVAYKQTYEKAAFNKLLGSEKLAANYINKKSYLARGHLSPDADFLFASWQYATYFYVNTVPQWQAVNNGNWKRLEMLVKHTGGYYRQDFQIYTGAHKILELSNAKGDNTKMYLIPATKKLAVPKFVWKIVYSEKSKKAIAFVSLNNPFAKQLTTRDYLCKDVCERYGWDNPSFQDGSKGFIYCCDARDLLGVVPTGPKLKINGILEAPHTFTRFADFN